MSKADNYRVVLNDWRCERCRHCYEYQQYDEFKPGFYCTHNAPPRPWNPDELLERQVPRSWPKIKAWQTWAQECAVDPHGVCDSFESAAKG